MGILMPRAVGAPPEVGRKSPSHVRSEEQGMPMRNMIAGHARLVRRGRGAAPEKNGMTTNPPPPPPPPKHMAGWTMRLPSPQRQLQPTIESCRHS